MGKREARFKELSSFEKLIEQLDESWIDTALELTGTATVRRRRLPAKQVLWLVLGMALYRDLSIPEVVDKLGLALPGERGLSVTPSAVPQARSRLGPAPVRWLFERCAQRWAIESARRHAFRGLAVFGIDCTSARVPDSQENRAHFGGHSTTPEKGESGYPLVRMATVMALRSHLLLGARFGPCASGETTLARELWPLVPDDSLCIVDRGFLAAPALLPYASQGRNRHWLTRAKSNSCWRVLRRLGRDDELVELQVSPRSRTADHSLPRTWVARAIRYQRRGFKPQTLLTSLLDNKLYPAEEIRALYHERWELELGFDEVKTEMLDREETLRSKSPRGVAQELWGIGLVYNLVRLEMERIAAAASLPPTRISFVMSLRLIKDLWFYASLNSPGTIPKRLRRLREEILRFVLPPRRSQRSYPRAVKIKMSGYPRKRTASTHAGKALI
jgi:hypothetical protein